MAKFCANCGNQMNDEDNVCSKCGTPVAGAQVQAAAPVAEASAQTETPVAETPVQTEASAAAETPAQTEAPVAETPVQTEAPAATEAPAQTAAPQAAAPAGKTISGKKLITIIGGALAAIFVLCIVIGVVSSMNSYKATLDKMVKALRKNDVETLEELSSSISEEVYGTWYGGDLSNYYEGQISNTLDKYEDSVGTIKKISYEITDETELSKRRVNELKDNLVDNYNMDPSDIKKVVNVSLQLTVKGSKKSSAYNVYDLHLIKESGGWKIFYGSLNY